MSKINETYRFGRHNDIMIIHLSLSLSRYILNGCDYIWICIYITSIWFQRQDFIPKKWSISRIVRPVPWQPQPLKSLCAGSPKQRLQRLDITWNKCFKCKSPSLSFIGSVEDSKVRLKCRKDLRSWKNNEILATIELNQVWQALSVIFCATF